VVDSHIGPRALQWVLWNLATGGGGGKGLRRERGGKKEQLARMKGWRGMIGEEKRGKQVYEQ